MKININKNNIVLFINKKELNLNNQEDLEMYIRKMILKIRKKSRDISGIYKVYVYKNKNYGIIAEIYKEKDFDFFKDFIDLKITIKNDSDMYLNFKDFFLLENKKNIYYYNNNYYINIMNLNDTEIIKLSEFSNIIYGKNINPQKWIKI